MIRGLHRSAKTAGTIFTEVVYLLRYLFNTYCRGKNHSRIAEKVMYPIAYTPFDNTTADVQAFKIGFKIGGVSG